MVIIFLKYPFTRLNFFFLPNFLILQSILRHLDKKQFEVANDNLYASSVKTDDINQNSTNYGSDEANDSNLLGTNFHRHRHQHADLAGDVSSVPNPRSSEFLIKDKRNERQLSPVVPDTCYCIPHSKYVS